MPSGTAREHGWRGHAFAGDDDACRVVADCVSAGLPCYFLREYAWLYRVGSVIVVLVETAVLEFVVGGQRAIVTGAAYGLSTLRLGRSMVRLVFERMLGATKAHAIPLADAEELLHGSVAVEQVAGETGQGGWLRRKISGRLLELVPKTTRGCDSTRRAPSMAASI